MRNDIGLPPDIRENMEEQQQRPAAKREMGGIGASAHENTRAAQSRDFAVSGGSATAVTEEQSADPAEKSEELRICPNGNCEIELNDEWFYCAKCGADLLRGGLEERLGIKFDEDDISDYIFKGYILKEVKILGKHTALLKTSQPKDLDEIDGFIMDGNWSKGPKGKDRKVSDFYLQQMNTLAIAAASLQGIDNTSIGETLPEKVNYLSDRGSAFVDRLTERVSLYNQALAEFLKKEDTIPGS